MIKARKMLVSALVLAVVGTVQAQPSQPEPTVELGADIGVDAKLSAEEMRAKADLHVRSMQEAAAKLNRMRDAARESKDIIRLNCVNDKLLQVKQLLNIAESAHADLGQSLDDGNRVHQFSMVTISAEKTSVLRDEAEACLGEELVFAGPTTISVDSPNIVDDPTRGDPFQLGGFDLERPTYATPFL